MNIFGRVIQRFAMSVNLHYYHQSYGSVYHEYGYCAYSRRAGNVMACAILLQHKGQAAARCKRRVFMQAFHGKADAVPGNLELAETAHRCAAGIDSKLFLPPAIAGLN